MSTQIEPPTSTRVVVIGAGMAGIAATVKLRRWGIDDFVVLEKNAGPGGTWWDNRYPGVEVDVPSDLYSFSFARHVFTRSHAGADELREYVAGAVTQQGLWRHMYFNQQVQMVRWNDDRLHYVVTTASGHTLVCRYVISCVGLLSHPRIPEWSKDSPFSGTIFHTARWEESVSLDGKSVAVVGTGSSSAQVIPELAKVVKHLYVYQREPGWVLPKLDRTFSDRERQRLRSSPWRLRLRRLMTYLWVESFLRADRYGSRANRRIQHKAEDYLLSAITDPDLRAKLTPSFPFGGKRPVLTQYYYPALMRPNVTLIPRAVTRLTEKGLVDSEGQETAVDCIVLATGFEASHFLATFDVIGRNGRDIHKEWADDPQSFLGMMATGFPNFFVTYGPNTNGGVVTFLVERQAEWIARAISRGERKQRVLDVRPSFVQACDWLVTAGHNRRVWSKTGNNYFTSSSGRVVTQWPYTQTLYWLLTRALPPRVACALQARLPE